MVDFEHPEVSAVCAERDVEAGDATMILENVGIAISPFRDIVRYRHWFGESEGMSDRRIDIGRHLVLTDIPLFPAYAGPQEQTVAIRQVLHQLGMSHVQTGPRTKAGIHQQRIDVALAERVGRELSKGGELSP